MTTLNKTSKIVEFISVKGVFVIGLLFMSEGLSAQPNFCFCECQELRNGPSSGVKGTFSGEGACVSFCQTNYGSSAWHRCNNNEPFHP